MADPLVDDQNQEDATELRFPKEFEDPACDALLVSEVYLLLEHRRVANDHKDDIEEMSEVFIKTLDYARRMSRFKNRETIRSIRGCFASAGQTSFKPLHKYEVAQCCNLCPDTAEEAKSLIPSLESKLEDQEFDQILAELHNKRSFE